MQSVEIFIPDTMAEGTMPVGVGSMQQFWFDRVLSEGRALNLLAVLTAGWDKAPVGEGTGYDVSVEVEGSQLDVDFRVTGSGGDVEWQVTPSHPDE